MAVAEDQGAGPGMVLLAVLVSRVEALVVGSMLDAAGIMVNLGGINHVAVEVNSLALGGHRLWVPAGQYHEASAIVREVLGDDDWAFSRGLRRAVLKFIGLWAGINTAIAGLAALVGAAPWSMLLLAPLNNLIVPVNPQGRGDYYLADKRRD